MTDKERILMVLVKKLMPKALFPIPSSYEQLQFAQSTLSIGDLVIASTTPYANSFTVGFLHNIKPNGVYVIREIGTNNLCTYSNESFYKVPRELLGFEILEGVQYKTYKKVLKAFDRISKISFGNILYENNLCIVFARKPFSNEIIFKVEFSYNAKTTIKSIVNLLETTYNSLR